MLNIKDDTKCCGCRNCEVICPTSAIIMMPNVYGFIYPKIDKNKCIACDRCSRVCPILNEHNNNASFHLQVIAYKINLLKDRMSSQSGGAFASLAQVFIKMADNPVVYGVAMNDKVVAEYQRITMLEQVKNLVGSKYVQADMNCIQRLIEQDIKSGRAVLFCGTPCYVSAIKQYAGTKRLKIDKLLLVDFLCHGVLSPLIFEEYKNYLRNELPIPEIERFRFRDKNIDGWGGRWSTITTKNKKYIDKNWLNIFHSDNYHREICYACQFAKKERNSDITLSDYWTIGSINQTFTDTAGVSCMIVNTYKGEKWTKLMEESGIGSYFETKYETAVQRPLYAPTAIPEDRDSAVESYRENGIESLIEKDKIVEIKYGIPLTKDLEFLKRYYLFRLKNSWTWRQIKKIIRR